MILQTSASLNLTAWAWRWKTPRSSARKIRTHAMKPTQCQPVISTTANMSPRTRLTPHGSRHAFDDGHLRPCAKLRALAFMPPEDQGAGGDHGSAQGLIERLVQPFPERAAEAQLQICADTVKEYDGVVGGEAD